MEYFGAAVATAVAASAYFTFHFVLVRSAARKAVRSIEIELEAFVRRYASSWGGFPYQAAAVSPGPRGALVELAAKLPLGRAFLSELAESRIRMKEELFLKALLALSAASFAGGWLAFGSPISGIALSFGLAAALRAWVRRRSGEKKKRLQEQLPEALVLVANALSSGASLVQALEHAVRESRPPISEELGRVVDEVRIGVGLDDALGGLNERITMPELESIVVALTMQRRTGGNLAELLMSGADMLKDRARLKGQLLAETSQARFSGKVVGFLPVIVLGITFLIDPGYLSPLFETATGLFLLGLAAAAEISGFAIINGLLKIDF